MGNVCSEMNGFDEFNFKHWDVAVGYLEAGSLGITMSNKSTGEIP